MTDIQKGNAPQRGRARSDLGKIVASLVETAAADRDEWYSVLVPESHRDQSNVHSIALRYIGKVFGEVRVQQDRLWIKIND